MPRLPKSFKGNRNQGKGPYQRRTLRSGISKPASGNKQENGVNPPWCRKCNRCHFGSLCYGVREVVCFVSRGPGNIASSCPNHSKLEDKSGVGISEPAVVKKEEHKINPPKCDKCRRIHVGTTCYIPRKRICYACRKPGHYARDCPYPPKQKVNSVWERIGPIQKVNSVWKRIGPIHGVETAEPDDLVPGISFLSQLCEIL